MPKIYLDYSATTPVDITVVKAMTPFFAKRFGNASSLHWFGREAQEVLDVSRKTIAKALNASSGEIIFTSSATESNNLVIKGLAMGNKDKNHIIISSIEHESVLLSAEWLQREGFLVTYAPVDKDGLVNSEYIREAITEKTILVSVMHASNEIGTIQPIEEIAKICKEKGVLFHTDASQTFGKISIDVKKIGIDLLTASSHKIYGPKGIGLLYIKKGIYPEPLLSGGGQEQGFRSSTENIPAIVGFAKAVELSVQKMDKENIYLQKLRDIIISEVSLIEGAHLTGSIEKRLVNNAHFWFDGIDGEQLVLKLDLQGIACSTGSACSATSLDPSHVLLAVGLSEEQAKGSLRITVGRQTTIDEVQKFITVLPKIIYSLRGQ